MLTGASLKNSVYKNAVTWAQNMSCTSLFMSSLHSLISSLRVLRPLLKFSNFNEFVIGLQSFAEQEVVLNLKRRTGIYPSSQKKFP